MLGEQLELHQDRSARGVDRGLTAPSVEVDPESALARGEWVSGLHEDVGYRSDDNAGVSVTSAAVAGQPVGSTAELCDRTAEHGVYAELRPCLAAWRRLDIDTTRAPEGTHELVLQAVDVAGNVNAAPPVTARIDNTAPGRVDVSVADRGGWRNHPDVALGWTNLVEADRAPIVAAVYKLCPAAGGECRSGEQAGDGLSRLELSIPSPGQWTASVWLRDAAGNENSVAASVPVSIGYDPDPPRIEFEPASPADPTLVAIDVGDAISGVAEGAIEISADGSGTWRALSAERSGDRFVAHIDDTSLPPGPYRVRARAIDQAGNEAQLDAAADGQPLTVTLPLRIAARMEGGFEREQTIRHTVRRNGREREVGRRVTVLSPAARVLFGESAVIAGRLVDPTGAGIPGAVIQVLVATPLQPEQLIGSITTDGEGRYRYTAAGASSRTVRLWYPGSPVILPAESRLALTVAATTALRADRTRLRNGQTVTFSGPVSTLPTPAGGKLIELQVRLPGRWETFQTIRTNDAGQWQARYRFTRTGGVQYYRFRARLPAEGGYPFAAGVSRVVTVRVRGA